MNLREELFNASLVYRQGLVGKGGCFCYKNLFEILLEDETMQPILCRVKTSYTKKGKKNTMISETFKIGIETLWDNGCINSLLMGEEGDDILRSVIGQWGEYLKGGYQEDKTVPLFVELKGYYDADEEYRKNYILNFICKEYLHKENITQEDRDAIVEIMKKPIESENNEKTKPSVILFLNGLDSINGSSKSLFDQLFQMRTTLGTQLIVTSIADVRSIYNWSGFASLNLIRFTDEEIYKYLKINGIKSTDNKNLIEVLKDQMMLEMYIITNKAIDKYGRYFKVISGCELKDEIQTAGEIIWNFTICCMLIKIYNKGTPLSIEDEQDVICTMKELLPKIGYKIEQNSSLYINSNELKEIINEVYISSNENISELPNDKFEKIIHILCDDLMLMRKKDDLYKFQDYKLRDYFSAIYIFNEIEESVKNQEIPKSMKEKPLSASVGTFLGEVIGEQYNTVRLIDKKWSIQHYKKTYLNEILDLCRGNFKSSTDFSVWNIIEIWKAVKGELSGEDLSNLNLLGISLNNIRCSRRDNEKYTAAKFDGSLINEKDILSQSHVAPVSSVSYSSDGKKILSASSDGTVKEWSTETGECLNTYTYYPGYLPVDINGFMKVNSAVYNGTGNKILTSSDDGTICEWQVNNAIKPLAVYRCENTKIKSAIYSPDEEKILSTNGNICEWKVGSFENPINIYTPKTTKGISDAVYSIDGKKYYHLQMMEL